MKKSLIAFLVALFAVSAVSTSCEKEEYSTSIAGTWEREKMTIAGGPWVPAIDNGGLTITEMEPVLERYIFNEDGTGEYKQYRYGALSYPFAWQLYGNTLQIEVSETLKYQCYIKAIMPNRLIIQSGSIYNENSPLLIFDKNYFISART